MKSSIIINFGIVLFISEIYGAPTPQNQNSTNGLNNDGSNEIYLDPYVILGAIPEMVDNNNRHINLNTVLANIPAKTPIDQVVKLTDWYSKTFAHYRQPVSPWVNSVLAASEKAKIDSTNTVNSLLSSRQVANSQHIIPAATTYSQFLIATEQAMIQQISLREYIQGIKQLFYRLSFEEKQIFDKTFQDIYGYSFINIIRESF